jgi:putative chitinase
MTQFNFNFTQDKLAACLANAHAAEWFAALSNSLPSHNIVTVEEVAEFLAQTAHESNNYTQLHENLNYSSAGLHATFPRLFPTVESAVPYARQPEKIGNKIYANRIGNGDESSGDGYRYRGRGILQITGRSNYATCSQDLYHDDRLLTNPDLLQDYQGAVDSACWFWTKHGLTALTDQGNFREVTHRINGGYLGESERESNYTKFLSILRG